MKLSGLNPRRALKLMGQAGVVLFNAFSSTPCSFAKKKNFLMAVLIAKKLTFKQKRIMLASTGHARGFIKTLLRLPACNPSCF